MEVKTCGCVVESCFSVDLESCQGKQWSSPAREIISLKKTQMKGCMCTYKALVLSLIQQRKQSESKTLESVVWFVLLLVLLVRGFHFKSVF